MVHVAEPILALHPAIQPTGGSEGAWEIGSKSDKEERGVTVKAM